MLKEIEFYCGRFKHVQNNDIGNTIYTFEFKIRDHKKNGTHWFFIFSHVNVNLPSHLLS
jgi:hypothetical protein